MTDIPPQVTKPEEVKGDIPQSVTTMPQGVEAPEAKPNDISFVNYNNRMCEIEQLDRNKAKKAIQTFKTIGTKIHSLKDYQRHAVDRIPVSYDGDYKKLFSGLPQDVELKEIKLQEKARIFYYDIEPERTFYVVAITQNHLETDKVRR
jgi:hypothetical protein